MPFLFMTNNTEPEAKEHSDLWEEKDQLKPRIHRTKPTGVAPPKELVHTSVFSSK